MNVIFHPQEMGININPQIAKEPFPTYEGEYEITPTTEEQIIQTKDKYMAENISIKAIQRGTVHPWADIRISTPDHMATIIPKADISEGWIDGATYTGSNGTVTPRRLVSGHVDITENGTVDVTNYASAVVNVQPSVTGDISITQNGTFNVASYANAIVDVPLVGMNYETGIFTPTSNIAKPSIPFAQERNTNPFFVMMVDCSTSSASTLPTSSSGIMWCLYRPPSFIGDAIITRKSSSLIGYTYAIVDYMYTGSSNTTTARVLIDDTPTSVSLDVFLTTSQFTPYMTSTSRYWRKDRTYKWIAVWDSTS